MSNIYRKRLQELRHAMAAAQIDYYYVPATDAHQNEYIPDCWQRRRWISGFTGSAGDLLVGKEQAYLWTDARYFLQAEQELDPQYFQLMKRQATSPSIPEWLQTQGSHYKVAMDPQLISWQEQQQWHATLADAHTQLIPTEKNWVDRIWLDRSSAPTHPIEHLAPQYTGRSFAEKLSDLRIALTRQGAQATVLSRLDAIAWLFNIRGSDIAYNPLVIAYAIVTPDTVSLLLDLNKISVQSQRVFSKEHITVRPYESLPEQLATLTGSVLLDPQETSWWVVAQLQKINSIQIRWAPSPVALMKAQKNATEQAGMREAHRIDAIAMVKFLHWIESTWKKGLTEISAAQRLEQFRLEDQRCKGLSFPTISAFAEHGAIIHYTPNPHSNKTINQANLYLVDSGGQYYEGTTDVTRVIHLGQPTPEEKHHYTLVLQGHLALRHSVFPAGTCGAQLDSLARHPLWQTGHDYAHGTGHGVGCYLCVHEGPQCISSAGNKIPLLPGMVLSNEPGLYRPGHYGIRIENVCIVQACETLSGFFTFDDLTLLPYAKNLINREQLTAQEIHWVNSYHQTIRERLLPDLPPSDQSWLRAATDPL